MDNLPKEVGLVRVYSTELEVLREYVEAFYQHDDHFDSMVNIDSGIRSLFRNDALATPYFIKQGVERIGYVILTRYHSIKKGGLTIFIDELYVESQFRRGGVGSQILSGIRQIAAEAGAKHLWVQTEPHSTGAQEFFEKAGFQIDRNVSFELPL